MSWKCRNIAFFCCSLSKPFLMSRHCSSGVATLSFDVLRDVTGYVVTLFFYIYLFPLMSRRCRNIGVTGMTLSIRCHYIALLV